MLYFLNEAHFNNKTVEIYDQLQKLENVTNDGEPPHIHTFGKIKGEEIYFYLLEIRSCGSFECCDSIDIYYSDKLDDITSVIHKLEKYETIDKPYNVPNKKLFDY